MSKKKPAIFATGKLKWVPDEESKACFWCQASFSLTRRKHHCRCCGQIFCEDSSKSCWPYEVELPSEWGAPQKKSLVCIACRIITSDCPMLYSGLCWALSSKVHSKVTKEMASAVKDLFRSGSSVKLQLDNCFPLSETSELVCSFPKKAERYRLCDVESVIYEEKLSTLAVVLQEKQLNLSIPGGVVSLNCSTKAHYQDFSQNLMAMHQLLQRKRKDASA
mmetsp:Transcript_28651/g.56293  ORF Transcript_28651/g.56293 Transcript_28651/m.56293 type:complete len:220 (-) Transcript_28651:361-1020(-)